MPPLRMKVFQYQRLPTTVLLPFSALHSIALAVTESTTPTSSQLTIVFIVIPVIVGLVCIAAFFVWKRKQNRKHRDDRGYNLPSTTARSRVSRVTLNGNTVLDRRVDSVHNKHRNDRKKKTPRSSSYRSSQHRAERSSQRSANKTPTHARQQQQQSPHQNKHQRQIGSHHQRQFGSHYQHQYGSHHQNQHELQYAIHYEQRESFLPPPPPPPPPEMPMLEPQDDENASLSMLELQQSQMWEMSGVESVQRRQTDPAVIARTQEAAEKVMAELAEDPEFEESWIPYDSLLFTRALSQGAFGEVWLAQLENTQVAVKKILDEKKHDVSEIVCFGEEIKLLALLKHPKIVAFIGVSWSDKQDLCAVTEFMAKGDLCDYLGQRKGKLNWPDHKLWLAEDVAEALVYLHSLSPKIIHRDLKSKNILLDNKYRAKLSDFGISRKRSLEETMTAGVGTIYWTAPEVLMGKKYTEKADIYSFGVVMSEMDTCEVPYSDKCDIDGKELQNMTIIQLVLCQGLRPSFLASCPIEIRELADRCLNANPDTRPDAPELLNILRDIQHDVQH